MLHGRLAGSPRGNARTGRAPRNSKAMVTKAQNSSRRFGEVALKMSFGQRRGMECSLRWPPSHPRRVRQCARALRAVVGSPQGEARTGRPARDSEPTVTKMRTRSRQTSEVAYKRSLGQRRGVERAPRWLQRQPRQVRQCAHAPCAVGWFSTGRTVRGPRDTEFGSYRHIVSKPQPETWRSVEKEEPQSTAWDGARSALPAKTTTLSPPARACSVGARPVLHRAKRARAAQLGVRALWLRASKAAADDQAWGRCRKAPAKGGGCSAPCVGREDNHTKSASAHAPCAAG